MHIRISFHKCLDLFSWRNEARPVQLLSTLHIPQGSPEYRKECSAVFAMIEWNVLLSENIDSVVSCVACSNPIARFGGLSLLSFVMRRFHSLLTLHSITPLISSAASQRESCIDSWRCF